MPLPHKKEILKLYKNLLRYGEQLKYTDKHYFRQRIRQEFNANRSLTEEQEISFNFEKGIILLMRRTVL